VLVFNNICDCSVIIGTFNPLSASRIVYEFGWIWNVKTTKSNVPAIGTVPSAFDCYLLNRGLKTLAVRMAQHQKNGLAVARFLEADPRVEKVRHPGNIL